MRPQPVGHARQAGDCSHLHPAPPASRIAVTSRAGEKARRVGADYSCSGCSGSQLLPGRAGRVTGEGEGVGRCGREKEKARIAFVMLMVCVRYSTGD